MKTMAAVTLFSLVGCEMLTDTGDLTSGPNGLGKGQLAISVPAPITSDIAGFQISVYGPEMVSCNPMPSGSTAANEYVALMDKNFPGGKNKFSDKFFVLQAGTYCVEAAPLNSDGWRVDACSLAQGGPYQITPSQTNTVMLVSNCGGADNGGLNPTVVENHKPLITELLFDRGQSIGTCETLHVTAAANDPDNNTITYEWLVQTKPGSDTDFDASSLDNVYTFRSFVPGDYAIELRVCDFFQFCAFMDFTIHVTGDNCAPLP